MKKIKNFVFNILYIINILLVIIPFLFGLIRSIFSNEYDNVLFGIYILFYLMGISFIITFLVLNILGSLWYRKLIYYIMSGICLIWTIIAIIRWLSGPIIFI